MALNFPVPKPARLALSKMWTSIFCLSKDPYDNNSWLISLRNLNIILGAWNGFSGKCRESCDRFFFLNQDFWKYGFWWRDWSAYSYFASFLAKYEIRGKYLPILHKATCDKFFIVKYLLESNVSTVILLTNYIKLA